MKFAFLALSLIALSACVHRATPPSAFEAQLRLKSILQDVAVQEQEPPRAHSPSPIEPDPGSKDDAATHGSTDLALKLQNPVADLISVPIQTNVDYGFGPKHAARTTVNLQPVIPIGISEDWMMISRTIFPVVHAESPSAGIDDEDGLGDTLQSFFFSPREAVGGWILGAGPAFTLPTATEDEFGAEKWSAGPTIVALRQHEGLTYGMLANHQWSFAGNANRDEVNATFLQPFFSYTLPSATSFTLNTESLYDWRHHEWTVPVNAMVSQLVKLGNQPINLSLGYRHYFDAPSGGPEWGFRFVITFLFPK